MLSKKGRSRAPSTIFHLYPWAKCDFWTKLLTKAEILASRAHILGCNKFSLELKMGMHAKVGSLSGLLLTILGLKKSENGPLFDKTTSKTTRAR